MADPKVNVFTSSSIFTNGESKAKFMDYLTNLICELHDIPDLTSLEYGKHILSNKILPRLHAQIIQIPITVCFRGSLKSFTQQQLKQGGVSMFMSEILKHIPSSDLVKYNLERVMVLGLDFKKCKNEFPIYLGLRTNVAHLSNLAKEDELVQRFLNSAYNVILAPHENNIHAHALPLLSEYEYLNRVQFFQTFGSFSSLNDLIQGAICIPRNPLGDKENSLSDELLLLPTQSLLVDYAEHMCSEEYPVFQLKTDSDKPSMYSLLSMQGARTLENTQTTLGQSLADYSKTLVDLEQIKFTLLPIGKLPDADTSDKKTFTDIYHARVPEGVDPHVNMNDGNNEEEKMNLALNAERSVTFEIDLTFMALPKQLDKNIFSDAPTLVNAPIFLTSEDIDIKHDNINPEDVNMIEV